MINSIHEAGAHKVLGDNRKTQGQEKQTAVFSKNGPEYKDTVSLGENSSDKATYSISRKVVLSDPDFPTLKELLVNLLEEQGIVTRIADGDDSIDFRDLTPEKARELISDDGYFGVEQTSDRIVQFAISLAGNDPERLEEIRKSIHEGFRQAKEALGGALPDISMKTYGAVMEKLNAWAAGSAARHKEALY